MATKEKTESKEELLHQNMRFYGQVQNTPQEARRTIGAGRLKGFTDINAMWRIKKLTELFGPAGIGWWTQNEEYKLVEGPVISEKGDREVACFCTLQLVYVDPVTKQESHPIAGLGGNKFVTSERNGPYCNDEAYKMAYTDALSIACKSLGFSSDIYFGEDRSKYRLPEDAEKDKTQTTTKSAQTAAQPATQPVNQPATQPAAEVVPMPQNSVPTENLMDLPEVINELSLKFEAMIKNFTPERKVKMAKWIESIIGMPNYKACTDAVKLNKLLEEVNKLKAA